MKQVPNLLRSVLGQIYKDQNFIDLMFSWDKFCSVGTPVNLKTLKKGEKIVKVLHIKVNDTSTSLNVTYQKAIIIKQINNFFGYKFIDDISILIKPIK